MAVCVNCIYHEENKGDLEMFVLNHNCTNPKFVKLNFVTGTISNRDCYELNSFGECKGFESKVTDEPVEPPTEEPTEPPTETETPPETTDTEETE